MLSSLIYVSQSTFQRGHSSDVDILRSAVNFNEKNDITGCLIRGDTWFAQIIEGAQVNLARTFDRILSDSRHSDIRFWWSNDRDNRLCPEWRMIMADAENYGTDLLPMLMDSTVNSHSKQGKMLEVVSSHLAKFNLRSDDKVDASQQDVKRQEPQRYSL